MQAEHKIEYGVEPIDFIEIYNKSVGTICNEYIGKYLVIFTDDNYDIVNSLSEIKEPSLVKELYIDGLVITDKEVFYPFLDSIERIHGTPVLEITDMSEMFGEFQYLKSIDLGGLATSNVTTMSGMFSDCESLEDIGDLSGWNTSNVTTMECMFSGCLSLKSVGDLRGWDMSSVTDVSHMFNWCKSLVSVEKIGEWDMSNVTNMSYMFAGCTSLTDIGDLGGWNTSNCTDTSGMFSGCDALISIEKLGEWDMSNVTDMGWMFNCCKSLTSVEKLGSWTISSCTNTRNMFSMCVKFLPVPYDEEHKGELSDMSFEFQNKFLSSGLSRWNMSHVTDMTHMFYKSDLLIQTELNK